MLQALKGNAMLKLTTTEQAKLTKAWDAAAKKVKKGLESKKLDGRTKLQLKRLLRMSPMLALTVLKKIQEGRDLRSALTLTVG